MVKVLNYIKFCKIIQKNDLKKQFFLLNSYKISRYQFIGDKFDTKKRIKLNFGPINTKQALSTRLKIISNGAILLFFLN